MTVTRFSAIPTEYCGIRFRSRLEATWAAYFEMLDIAWEYEPVDLAGYIPDFYLEHDRRGHEPLLTEVKPATDVFDLLPVVDRIKQSWGGRFLVVGVTPAVTILHACRFGCNAPLEWNSNYQHQWRAASLARWSWVDHDCIAEHVDIWGIDLGYANEWAAAKNLQQWRRPR